jgi:hypothetical protein
MEGPDVLLLLLRLLGDPQRRRKYDRYQRWRYYELQGR